MKHLARLMIGFYLLFMAGLIGSVMVGFIFLVRANNEWLWAIPIIGAAYFIGMVADDDN